jgi:acyl transferase domain-containing protein
MLKRVKKQKSQNVGDMKSSKYLANAKKSHPAAIVGMACRFPGGVNSKDDFWDLLVEGRCGIGPYPANRPDSRSFIDCYSSGKNTPGKHHVLTGCFLEHITGFDNQFFRISPTESCSMDPQQRILLQVVYEAIEDAGIRLEDLQQCRTGVYVGLMNTEFGALLMQPSHIRNIDQFCSTGVAASIAANRISFSLNLTGPSLTLDTACSSSLVAFDIAFGHLQSGECDVAIVCAPNILLTGYQYHLACCRTGLLADDGRCKSFDIKGDGYGRGEGVAAVVIKPTKTAKEDHDDIYAEVVACGVNNDGQTAIPLTAPSEVTQAALFQRVLQESGLSKDDIQYVEVHGTGTAIGDVVEMGSVASVYGNSSNRKLRLGSVKSNVNHTESTAGLSGLIKTCLMIKHGQFVPTVNVQEVKPQLKISERKMMVQLRNEPWNTDGGAPRTAAVSSYGFGGTNAHVIVREVIKIPETGISKRSAHNRVMTLSAASKDALREMAQKVSLSFQTKSDDDEILKDNICYSLNERYTVHSHRLALSFSSFKHATRALQMFADKEKGWEESVAYGEVNNTHDKIVFLYGGQGSQWYGMAREMLMHEPKFKESIEKIDSLLKRYGVSWSLISELNKSEETSRLDENPIGQTALFAIHFALTELLESWGVTPSAVVGHSLGEISAAWASGALRLHKALQLVLFRSQLHEKCSPTGCMVAIGLSEENARNLLQDLALESEVDVAVVNSPGNVVLSGSRESIELVEKHVINSRSDLFLKKLSTTRAYHSREMEEIKQSFFKLTSKFNVRQTHTNIPFYSTVTGDQLSGQLLTLEHWWRNIRQAVLLEPALKTIFSDGYHFFTEINATPQLSYHIRRTWSHNKTAKSLNGNDAVVIQTIPKRSARQQHLSFLQNCAANLFTNGVQLTWSRLQGSGSQSFSPRPTYPWQEREFWYRKEHPPEFVTFLDGEKPEENKDIMAFHPLLGKAVPTEMFTGLQAWESEINLYSVSYISDHKFSDSPEPVLPASLYVEMVLALSLHLSPSATPDVHNISFDHLLTISESDSHKIRTRLLPEKWPANGNQFQITIVNESEIEVVLSEGCIQLGVNDSYGNKGRNQVWTKNRSSDKAMRKHCQLINRADMS